MGFHVVVARSSEVLGKRAFEGPRVRIGRDPGSELLIDHPTLSRQHALIERQGEAWTVRDEGSANGTLVNGKPLTGARTLNEKDEIQVGDFTLVFHAGEPGAADVPTVVDRAAYAVFGQTLQVRPGGEHELRERSATVHAHLVDEKARSTFALDRDVLLLGRGAGCHVHAGSFLFGARVAAAIVRGHGGWSLVRLGSRRVSWQGEKVADRAWLSEGDRFAVSGREFVFKLGLPKADAR